MGSRITNFGNYSSIWNFPQTPPSWFYDLVLEQASNNGGISVSHIQKDLVLRRILVGQFSDVAPNQTIREFLSKNQNSTLTGHIVYRGGLLDEQWQFDDGKVLVSDFVSDLTNAKLAKMFDGDDVFTGSMKLGDYVNGYAGNDRMSGFGETPGGLDIFFGGDGVDTAVFNGSRSKYAVNNSTTLWDPVRNIGDLTGFVVTQKNQSVSGSAHLYQVERIAFTDVTLAFDTDGGSGQAYRVYKAAFNRDPMSGDAKGLGYWIAQIEKGMDLIEVSARFVDSNEFRTLYGANPTNGQFLTKLYQNVLGRDPEASGYNWWLNELNTNPSKTKAKVLADFAESGENQAGVASLIGSGITYEPWVG
jgi:Domain of unknown function (DUF4214)